jgi:transcriptional regulator with PAS, ATPase and Fis domain
MRTGSTKKPNTKLLLETVKVQHIREVLKSTHNNKNRAAKLLGVSIRALRLWVASYPSLKSFKREALKPRKRKEDPRVE